MLQVCRPCVLREHKRGKGLPFGLLPHIWYTVGHQECFLEASANEMSHPSFLAISPLFGVPFQLSSYSSSKTAWACCPIRNLPWSPRAGLNPLPLGFLEPCTQASLSLTTAHSTYLLQRLLPTPDVEIMKTGTTYHSSSYPHLLGKASGTQKALYNDLSS